MQALNDFFLPPAKSTLASQMDSVFWYVHLSSLLLTIGVVAAVIFFIIKYRRKSDDDVTPVITHNNHLEVTWSVIPLIMALISFAWGYQAFTELRTAPDDSYEVNVTAQRWNWQFRYANGAQMIDELHVPAGRPIKLIMSSRDVIHSFFVPDYRIKQDVVPNRYTMVWFEAMEPGESIVYCTEYCGTDHSAMLAKVVVHEPEEFETWLENNAGGASQPEGMEPAEWGEELTQQYACQTCHSTDGSELTGPTWQGLFGSDRQLADGSSVEADENYIRESILTPDAKIAAGHTPGMMNSYQGQLSDEQIDAIIEFIKTLE